MPMRTYILLFITLAFLSACGPSAAEIETQRILKNQLIELKSQLAGEEARLESIQGFIFLRTRSEKAQQITDQTRVIEKLKAEIQEVKKQIRN